MSFKPKGSGWFSIVFGLAFLLTFLGSSRYDYTKIAPQDLFESWLLFIALVLIFWGIDRVKHGQNSLRIGQPTINFIVAIMGITFALLALILDKS